MHPLHKPVSFMFATLNGLLLCQDLVLGSVTRSRLTTSMEMANVVDRDCVGVSPLCCRLGTGIWRVYESTPWPISPSTDTRVVSVVLRVIVLRSTHNYIYIGKGVLRGRV